MGKGPSCLMCGCTNGAACNGGCSWTASNLCNAHPGAGASSLGEIGQVLAQYGDRPRLVLVGCGYRKQPHPSPAVSLYTGPLYRLALRYAGGCKAPTAILSAKYGVIGLRRKVQPYDRTVHLLQPTERSAWGRLVLGQLATLRAFLPRGGVLEVIAADAYVKPWRLAAESLGWEVRTPLTGMGSGLRCAWLAERAAALQGEVRRAG